MWKTFLKKKKKKLGIYHDHLNDSDNP